jgi:hypothetical protein
MKCLVHNNVSYFFLEFMNKIKLIGLMAVCDEHIIYQSLNALFIWDFLKVFFKENIKVNAYFSQI